MLVAFIGQCIQGKCEFTEPALLIFTLAGVSAIMVVHTTLNVYVLFPVPAEKVTGLW